MQWPDYNLTSNPFRITPAILEEELVWAGFPALKGKIENRIFRSLKSQNSSLVLNWGEYGSGKTHAARFFTKESAVGAIAKRAKTSPPYCINLPLPKGKEPVRDIYISIIDNLDLNELRQKHQDLSSDASKVIDQFSYNRFIQSVLLGIFSTDFDDILLKKYLYGQTTRKDLETLNATKQNPILRPLQTDNDYISLLAALFTALTYDKAMYSCIVLWIDEFEDIAILSSSNIDKTNNFLRELLDHTPNNLLVFLNLTQSALFRAADLSNYLFDSVKSRIKERINFELPTTADYKDFLKDLFSKFRTGKSLNNPYHPLDETTVDLVLSEMSNSSIRALNEVFSLLLELADLDKTKIPITTDYWKKVRGDIVGWKDE